MRVTFAKQFRKILQQCVSLHPSSTFPTQIPRISDIFHRKMTTIRSVKEAEQFFLQVDKKENGQEVKLWCNTWGNPQGIPVIFVHGGPGNCVEDYDGINADFFDKDIYFVVEVDQRGTGKSTPSVRDLTPCNNENGIPINQGVKNMEVYSDITISQMSADFERVRDHLKIQKWLVFGGSWGSTLGLDYAERYPDSCIALILRGIFLDISEEMDAVFTLKAVEDLAQKMANNHYIDDFNHFFEPAAKEFKKKDEGDLSPNDAEGV